MSFWTAEVLSKLRFDSNKELHEYMNIEAFRSGFTLCSRRAHIDPYGMFYCSKAGSSDKSTNKCNCSFSFTTAPIFKFGKMQIAIKIDNTLNLQHSNHAPDPQEYVHRLLPDDTLCQIQKLHESGLTPTQIQTYLLKTKQPFISTLQIQNIVSKEFVKTFTAESENLIHYMKSNGGIVEELNLQSNDEIIRFAVLTFHLDELKNLRDYGDVLFIDGTYASLASKWEVFPLTAITNDGTICSCGIMYTASANEEVLLWMLNKISMFPDFLTNIRAIITDEDHAFISAFKSWIETIKQSTSNQINVNHILCALHKSRNFAKKLLKYGLSKAQREIAKNLFKIICYHPNKAYVDEAIQKLSSFGPRLNHYLAKHVLPYINNFAKAYISLIDCHGYNTTSPSESMNNLIKRSLRKQDITLIESRMHFDQNLINHKINSTIQINSKRRPNLFEGSFAVSLRILEKIEVQLKISSNIEILHQSENVFLARHKAHQSIIYKIENGQCSCNLQTFAGYPCAHILQLFFQLKLEFPIFLISKRWVNPQFLQCNSCTENNLIFNENEENVEIFGEVYHDDTCSNETNEEEMIFTEEDVDEMTLDDITTENISVNEVNDTLPETKTERYLKLLHKGKELAKLGSNDGAIFQRLINLIQTEINSILNIPNDAFQNDNFSFIEENKSLPVHDAVAKPKGAPKRGKKTQSKNLVDHNAQPSCEICTGHHNTIDCQFYEEMNMLVEKNKKAYINDQGRRCSLCLGIGHQNRTCPLRIKAKEYYQQKSFI